MTGRCRWLARAVPLDAWTGRRDRQGRAAGMGTNVTKLIDKETQEQVVMVGPILEDGRTLIQRLPDGPLDVIDASRLAVVQDDEAAAR